MALIIEDGSLSTPSANTYATANYVTTYCSNLGLSEWGEGYTETWETAILRAMAYIESRNFKGIKADYDENVLKWPRAGVYDEDGYAIDDDEIPENLKRALARAAYEEYIDPGVLQRNLTRDDFTTSESVGPISMSYQQGKASTIFRAIDAYLEGLVEGGNTVYRT